MQPSTGHYVIDLFETMARVEQATLFNMSTTALHVGLDLDTESERCR